jgi:two-component system chemotaxis response regulator CheB
VLSRGLLAEADIDVVGAAPDPFVARDMIVELKPDVVLLDIEMPRMDGLTFLGKLMTYYPLPVIIISSLTPEGSELALQALQLGAIEVLCKPGAAYTLGNMVGDLVATIRVAARTNIRRHLNNRPVAPTGAHQFTALLNTTQKILAVGASTGGTVALEYLLKMLPPQTPGMVVVQHMPVQFTKSFANRLNGCSTVEVREAEQGDSVVTGVVLIAPGDRHMVLERDGARYTVSLKKAPPVNRHCPSVDVLFNSVARTAGRNAVAAILTGMGADGAKGLLRLREAGARTIAQDEESCVVFGMPKVAIELGAAEEVHSLSDIPRRMLEMVQHANGRNARSA